jgi:hypothetical protein
MSQTASEQDELGLVTGFFFNTMRLTRIEMSTTHGEERTTWRPKVKRLSRPGSIQKWVRILLFAQPQTPTSLGCRAYFPFPFYSLKSFPPGCFVAGRPYLPFYPFTYLFPASVTAHTPATQLNQCVSLWSLLQYVLRHPMDTTQIVIPC